MAKPMDPEALMAFWKQQMEEGTKLWERAAQEAGDPSRLWRPFMDQGIAAWAALMAAGPVSPDLMAQWKQFLDGWIEAWGQALERAMSTEAFAQALGRYLEQWLSVQAPARQAMADAGGAALTAMGMPSRADLVGLTRSIFDLDDRLDQLEDRLQSLSAQLDGLRPPVRRGSARRARRKRR